MNKLQQKKLSRMKKAAMEQMLLWIILFISFVSIFFFIIDYSNAMRIKEAASSIANFGARSKAIGATDQEVVDRINAIKNDFVATVTTGDLSCSNPGTNEYKVTFSVEATVDISLITSNEIIQTVGAFNETSSADITCTLSISGN